MAVKHFCEVYRCNICGNNVEVIKVGGGTLKCCDKEMERIEDNKSKTTVKYTRFWRLIKSVADPPAMIIPNYNVA